MKRTLKRLAREALVEVETNKNLDYVDAVEATLMIEPDPNEHTLILEQVEWKGDHWEANLIYTDLQQPNIFFKKCISRNCRTEKLARILMEYNRSIVQLDRCENCNCALQPKFLYSEN